MRKNVKNEPVLKSQKQIVKSSSINARKIITQRVKQQ